MQAYRADSEHARERREARGRAIRAGAAMLVLWVLYALWYQHIGWSLVVCAVLAGGALLWPVAWLVALVCVPKPTRGER